MNDSLDRPEAVREDARLDLEKLGGWLAQHDLPGALEVLQFPRGYSNLTYLLRVSPEAGAPREIVLRRPPLGVKIASAHDMGREHRILSGLAKVWDKVPRTIGFEPDETVLGAPFYVMERAHGVIFRAKQPKGIALESLSLVESVSGFRRHALPRYVRRMSDVPGHRGAPALDEPRETTAALQVLGASDPRAAWAHLEGLSSRVLARLPSPDARPDALALVHGVEALLVEQVPFALDDPDALWTWLGTIHEAYPDDASITQALAEAMLALTSPADVHAEPLRGGLVEPLLDALVRQADALDGALEHATAADLALARDRCRMADLTLARFARASGKRNDALVHRVYARQLARDPDDGLAWASWARFALTRGDAQAAWAYGARRGRGGSLRGAGSRNWLQSRPSLRMRERSVCGLMPSTAAVLAGRGRVVAAARRERNPPPGRRHPAS